MKGTKKKYQNNIIIYVNNSLNQLQIIYLLINALIHLFIN